MGRHFEVRAASMAITAKKKSALYMRASKEIYLAAKQGEPDPNSNLTLRAALDKYRALGVSKDVIERAINKAKGTDIVAYIPGRYEMMGPGGSFLVVDTLTDNVNRAISDLKAAIKKIDGTTFTSTAYNFQETGVFVFDSIGYEVVEETLILNDIDVWEINEEDEITEVLVNPQAYGKTRDTLYDLGVNEFNISEIKMIPQMKIMLNEEDKVLFEKLINLLEEVQDVQEIYHNVELN